MNWRNHPDIDHRPSSTTRKPTNSRLASISMNARRFSFLEFPRRPEFRPDVRGGIGMYVPMSMKCSAYLYIPYV